jgi:hypothetical protein
LAYIRASATAAAKRANVQREIKPGKDTLSHECEGREVTLAVTFRYDRQSDLLEGFQEASGRELRRGP